MATTIGPIGSEFHAPRVGKSGPADQKPTSAPLGPAPGPDAGQGGTIFEKLKGILLEQDELRTEGLVDRSVEGTPRSSPAASAGRAAGSGSADSHPGGLLLDKARPAQAIYTREGLLQPRPDANRGAALHVLG